MAHANRSESLAGKLGPVLLQGKTGQADALVILVLGVLCSIGGAWLIAEVWTGANGGFSLFVALGMLMVVLGAVLAVYGLRTYWSKRGRRQFVHERGLRQESAIGTICIGYDEADELEYKLTDLHHNGAYVGTVDQFGLRTAGASGKEIVFRQVRRKRDAPTPFPPIVERISARLARLFTEAIGRGESVRWTSCMTIHPDGLTLAARPWTRRPGLAKFRTEQPARVGWDDIEKIEIDEGFCRIRLKGDSRPRLTVEVGEPNFHPGYRVVVEALLAQAASRPTAPVRGLAHGERISVEYPYSIKVRFGIERAVSLVDPKARKTAREGRIVLAVVLPVGLAGLAVMAFLEGKMGGAALQLRLLLCVLGSGAAYAAVEVWERLSTRRKVHREAQLAHDRYESGEGPDPAYLYRVTLGPPGFSRRMPQGKFQSPWSTVSRVLSDRGSIIICRAGNAVQPETIAVFIPALAFDDSFRARDAFERITEWHHAARNLADAS